MTSDDMARDYLRRAAARRKALDVLLSAAAYGDDLRGVPASDLFDEADARRAMAVADRLLDLYRRLLGDAGGTAG